MSKKMLPKEGSKIVYIKLKPESLIANKHNRFTSAAH